MSPDEQGRELPRFQQQQLAFAAHIRDPHNNPIPDGIEQRRMAVYTEIIYNGLNDQLSANFPVLRDITSDERWHGMLRDFFVRHRASTPLFTEIALEFLEYLQAEREPAADDWPFMLELAHYEYVELAVSISNADEQEAALIEYDPNGDLLQDHPLIAPTAWNLSYAWPVHRIGPEYLPTEPPAEPTHLVVYRDRSDEVHFLEINAVTQRLLTLLKENPGVTGLEVLKQIAGELQHSDPGSVIQAGRKLMAELRERHVILGSA
jgi:hypothetical protein